MFKRVAAAAALVLAGSTLIVTGTAELASAHDAPPTGTSSCDNTNWKITGTAKLQDVPAGDNGSTTVKISASAGSVSQNPGSSATPGNNTTYSYSVTGISLDVASVTVTSSTSWPGHANGDVRTITVNRPEQGCKPNTSEDKISLCHSGNGKNYESITVSKASFYVGHREHGFDIYPSGSFSDGIHDFSWNAQGDQSLLQYKDCVKPDAKDAVADVTVTPPTCDTAGHATASATFATLVGNLDQTPGDHTAHFVAADGHAFSDGSKNKDVPYTIGAKKTGDECATIVQPVNPTVTQDECTGPGTSGGFNVTLADGPQGVTYVYDANTMVVTATADAGHKFGDVPAGWVKVDAHHATYKVTKTSPGDCKVVLDIPAAPSQSDPCGLDNATWNVPANTEHLKWTLDEGGNLFVHIPVSQQNAYVFTDGTVSHAYGMATDSGELCPVSPVSPTVEQSTCNPDGPGIIPGTVTLPADTDTLAYTYDQETGIVTATVTDSNFEIVEAPEGWTVAEDGQSATFAVDLGNPGDCLDVIQPTTPTSTDACDAAPVWDPFPVVEHASWSTDENGNAVLTADEGFAFAQGEALVQSIVYTLPADDGTKCPTDKPNPIIKRTSSSNYSCGDSFERVTSTVTRTAYVSDDGGVTWHLGTPVTKTSHSKVPHAVVACPTPTPNVPRTIDAGLTTTPSSDNSNNESLMLIGSGLALLMMTMTGSMVVVRRRNSEK